MCNGVMKPLCVFEIGREARDVQEERGERRPAEYVCIFFLHFVIQNQVKYPNLLCNIYIL